MEGRERQGNEEAGTVRKAEENAAAGMLESEEPVAVNPVRENYERSRTPPPGYTFQPGRRT
ncbi:MAG: hypothetical protein M1379_17320 [Firmicutes bacterium]|nr:hypothetical protein [Bacillota bacterium]